MSTIEITPATEAYPIASAKWVAQQIQNINNANANGQFAVEVYLQGGEPIDALIEAVGTERKVIDNRQAGNPAGHVSVRFVLEAK